MTHTPLYKQTVDELRVCYDTHASKFSSTRKKNRPEMDYICQQLLSLNRSHLRILELGCGDGRMYTRLSQQHPDLITSYTGVDIAKELISMAQNNHPDNNHVQRHTDDMIHYISTCPDEQYDAIICLASFQHLPDTTSRDTTVHHIYRSLCYEGLFISIDRSWSWWMIQKYRNVIQQSLIKWLQTRGKREWNNLLIPFHSSDKKKTNYRLYHIFTITELKKLLARHGFHASTCIYSSQDGSFHHNILKARNICTTTIKQVFIP